MKYIEGKQIPETMEDLEILTCDWLTPEEAAPVLGTTPQTLLAAAKQGSETIGIPVMVLKSRVKIPRRGLIHFIKYGNAPITFGH